jgi:thiosulfate/3-mercaptopyruvate sulfurtransferase
MLPALALLASTTVDPIVTTDWLQAHLNDPQVRVIFIGERDTYDRAHIPGARFIDHMETLGSGHRPLAYDALARVLAKAGAEDGARIVLYGDSPMATGWVYMTIAIIGHGADTSLLDGGIEQWESEKRPTSKTTPPAGTGQLSVRPAADVMVDAAWVRSHLESPEIRILDVRTDEEWKQGHLPGATLVYWQDLFADRKTLKFKSLDDIRALLVRAGVGPNQQVVTYCAVGMRASLMYFAARAAGVPARVYVGSMQDWRRDANNPLVR